jgi:hypothetical protein
MKTTMATVLFLAAVFSGCALFKGALRTVSDLAESVCDILGTEDAASQMTTEELCTPIEGLDGFSLAEFCAVHKPLSPFIRTILRTDADACAGYGADLEVLGIDE